MKGIYSNKNNSVSIMIPTPEALEIMTPEEIFMKDSPDGITPIIINDSDLPKDNIFRDAWEIKSKKIKTNIDKAKKICHEIRRTKRTELFKPLDIEVTIPFKAKEAEAKRQIIRNDDDKMQIDIDNTENETGLLNLIKNNME